ncbi:TVP38/TMEM64 family protein [Blastopirellula marina]|uniref:TVP38/TMEM64 family membrane protein n=1 Tax=Blastopirellula marina TaxID=124 RepID=A0A2S8FM42_9BACT|nr:MULTISPECIES: TVP38/TMEM64 family protein [Pirellulaceae]PQO33236.1 TVP38/TMEM64 family protein [Blastopirellula marina]RCS52325.1 TVP38/TMEM64 family protein [Bremerella cremea]
MNAHLASDSAASREVPPDAVAIWLQRVRWIAVLVGAVCLVVFVRSLPTKDLIASLQSWISSLGVWGPVVLTLTYIVATVLLVPGTILTLVAGAIYGLGVGTVIVSIGSTIGASLCFLIARYAARERVARWAQRYPLFQAIDSAIGEGGWKIVALLRLSPAIPFNVQNYLYGLTPVRFWPYVTASWLAMLPGTFLYVYLGHITGAALSQQRERTPLEWALLGIGLAATVLVSVYIARLARSKIHDQVTDSTAAEPSASEPSETSEPLPRYIGRTLLLIGLALILVLLAINSQPIEAWLNAHPREAL